MIRRMAEGDSALDLRVWATRIQLGEPYTVFALLDISDEKRRAVLERIFFHDLLNVVSGLSGLIELECDPDNGQDGDLRGLTREVVGELIEQIRAGRDLTAAERGDLNVRLEVIDAAGFLWSLGERYRRTSLAVNRRIIVSPAPCALFVWSDRVLLSRVLGNLVKNALEASLPGEVVTMRAESGAGGVSVSIHNPSAIPQAVEAQLFQRSFSTKGGQGRGIGLYSVKLLTERYLGGSVSFSSSPEKGTTFTVTLPAAAAAA
jgi:signal transduction histidine kinase